MNRRSFSDGHQRRRRAGPRQNAAPAIPLRRAYSLNRKLALRRQNDARRRCRRVRRLEVPARTLPHTNVDLPWHSFDDKAYEFVSIYRRHTSARPRCGRAARVRDFGGVMTASKVTLNATASRIPRGYTPFPSS